MDDVVVGQGSDRRVISVPKALNELAGQLVESQLPASVALESAVVAALAAAVTTHEGEANPHATYQRSAEKGAANGYAPLDGTGLVPLANLPGGLGEANTASNSGAGVGVFKDKLLVDLRFKSLRAASDKVSVVNGAGSDTVDVDVSPSAIDHAALANLTSGDPHTQYQRESEKGAAGGYASLQAGSGIVPTGQLGSGAADASKFLRGDSTWVAPAASVAIEEVSIAFTDGDTLRRVSVPDAGVSASTKIFGGIRRPDTDDDSADKGYLYLWNVVRVYSGGFDLLVAATAGGMGDTVENPPNETIKYWYTKG